MSLGCRCFCRDLIRVSIGRFVGEVCGRHAFLAALAVALALATPFGWMNRLLLVLADHFDPEPQLRVLALLDWSTLPVLHQC